MIQSENMSPEKDLFQTPSGPHFLPGADRISRMDQPQLSQLVEKTLNFINYWDQEIHAMLPESGRCERLKADIAALLEEWPAGSERPPLFGLLAGVKDMYHLQGFQTAAGSSLPTVELTGPEDGAVARLRKAGALFLGKTVTTEFAWAEPGPTRNPVDPDRTPGGSSSGSAAAVALGYCHMALGTQTVGSVVRPAAFCGIWGFKPSYGRVPSQGLIPFSPSVDHPGLLAGTLEWLTLGISCLCDKWSPEKLDEACNQLPTVVIPAGPYFSKAGSETRWNVEAAASILMEAGVRILEIPFLEDMEEISALHRAIIARELHDVHRHWFSAHSSLYRPRTAELIQEGSKVSDRLYSRALEERLEFRGRVNETLKDLEGPAGAIFISPPTTGPAPRGLMSTGDPIMNLPWTFAGAPSIAMPWGDIEGLPLGLQFTAPFMSDERLLGWSEPLWNILSQAM